MIAKRLFGTVEALGAKLFAFYLVHQCVTIYLLLFHIYLNFLFLIIYLQLFANEI
jgi:hypothetical protein